MNRRLKIGSCNTHHRSVEADSIQTIIQRSTWGELKWAKSHVLFSKPKSTFQKKKIKQTNTVRPKFLAEEVFNSKQTQFISV